MLHRQIAGGGRQVAISVGGQWIQIVLYKGVASKQNQLII